MSLFTATQRVSMYAANEWLRFVNVRQFLQRTSRKKPSVGYCTLGLDWGEIRIRLESLEIRYLGDDFFTLPAPYVRRPAVSPLFVAFVFQPSSSNHEG